MKVKVSIYTKDRDTENIEWIYSKVLNCKSIKDLDDTLKLYDCFESNTFLSPGLCFYDIYSLGGDGEEYVTRLRDYNDTSTNKDRCKSGLWFCEEDFYPGEADLKVYPEHPFVLYHEKRFECGASGFSGVVYWISEHPIAMIFIGGAIWDGAKFLFTKLFGKHSANIHANSQYHRFSFKKFYRAFSKATGMSQSNFGIVDFKKDKNDDIFNIIVRNENDDRYAVKAKPNGKIISFKRK